MYPPPIVREQEYPFCLFSLLCPAQSRRLLLYSLLAEMAGFEPAYDEFKAHCLTAWRHLYILKREKYALN